MALVVETGGGLDNGETYASLASFQAFCGKWGLALTGHDDAAQEVALRKAGAFIDTFGRYKGRRLSAAQAMEFPRQGLTDWGGLVVEGVPDRVKRACMELAHKALTTTLLADLARGGRIASETVGPLSVSYAADAPAGTVYQQAEKLLAPYLREQLDYLSGPGRVAPEGALFEIGQHDAEAVAWEE